MCTSIRRFTLASTVILAARSWRRRYGRDRHQQHARHPRRERIATKDVGREGNSRPARPNARPHGDALREGPKQQERPAYEVAPRRNCVSTAKRLLSWK